MLPRIVEETGTQSSCFGPARDMTSECRKMQLHVTVKGFEEKQTQGRNKREFFKCHECGKFGMGVRSREASVFEAGNRGLAETRCVDMVNVDLNALEIDWSSAVARENQKIQVVFESCAAVIVFSHFRWFVTKSLQVLCGLECSKGERQARRCVIFGRESEWQRRSKSWWQ